MQISPLAWGITLTAVFLAAVIDIRTNRIPNLLVVPCFLGGFTVAAVSHGWAGASQSLLGSLVAVLSLGIFCYLGGLGMGDLKLCAAIGAWVGPSQVGSILIMTGLVGAALAICWSIAGGFFRKTVHGVTALLAGFIRRGIRPNESLSLSNPLVRRMPYAPAIAIGTLITFLGRR